MSGVGTFLRAFLRRDRWLLLWWTVGVMILFYSQAVSVDELYATQAEFDQAAASMEGNAAFIALTGPTRALNTVGGQVVWQSAGIGAVVVGLMSMFLVGRHTRAEEESGREELVRSTAVGRYSSLTAALVVALAANVVVGAAVAVSLATYPLELGDSVATGLGLTLTGWVFTATALVAAQLTSSTRSMYGIAGAVLGVAFGLRAVGDIGSPALSWLTPIGWYQAMHPFSGVRWWPVLLLVLAAGLVAGTAYAVFDRRDIGAGVLAARPGPATAGRPLASGFGLAWRLQRGSVLGWATGLLLTGLAYGSIGNDVADLVGDSQTTQDLFAAAGGNLVDGFYGTATLMLGLLTAGFAISSALRPRAEETLGHAESLLATGLSRRTWILGHITVTVAGVVLVLGAGAVGLGAGFAAVTGDLGAFARLSVPTLASAVPVLVTSGVAVLLYGAVPRAASAAWLVLGFATVVLLFGETLQMPAWLRAVSPFEHLALVPAETFRLLPLLVLTVVAATLSFAGQVMLTRRDIG